MWTLPLFSILKKLGIRSQACKEGAELQGQVHHITNSTRGTVSQNRMWPAFPEEPGLFQLTHLPSERGVIEN